MASPFLSSKWLLLGQLPVSLATLVRLRHTDRPRLSTRILENEIRDSSCMTYAPAEPSRQCSDNSSDVVPGSSYTSGGRPVQTSCTPCRLCRLFKPFKTTENKTLEFWSREVGDVIRPIKLTGIRKEPVQRCEKGVFLMSEKSVHGPKKVCTWCAYTQTKVWIKCAWIFCPSLCLIFLSTEQV